MRLQLKEANVVLLLEALSLLLMMHGLKCDYIPKWSCDFENGLCHWLQVRDNDLQFDHVTGVDIGWQDHTTNNLTGNFLYTSFESGYRAYFEDKAATLLSPVLMPNNGSCKMALHYRFSGYRYHGKVYLSVNMVTKKNSGSIHKKLLNKSYDGISWTRMDLNLQSNVEFQVEVSGFISGTTIGSIGVDDIWFTDGCKTNRETPIRLVKLWSSTSYNYPAGLFYEHMNGSWSTICSEKSALAACNLLGLKELVIGNSNSSYGHLKSGQGICLPSNITVPTSEVCNNESSCRQVTYWECKQDYMSICLERTHIACNSTVKGPFCVPRSQICDYHRDCPGGEDESDCLAYKRCDFQTDMCDWLAARNSLFGWTRYLDPRLGKYCLNVDSSHDPSESGIAKLRFRYTIEGSQNSTCMIRFTYRASVGTLRVVLKDIEHTRYQPIWAVGRSRGQWRRAVLELPRNMSFQLFFEASIYHGISSYRHYGLGNVSFSRGCKFARHTYGYSQNDSSIFVCHSGEAVSKEFVCDFNVNCFDGSDELNCSHIPDRCDFESSLCDWQIGSNAPELLRRSKGPVGSYFVTGPSRDHTNKYTSGYFVYLEATNMLPGAYGYLISRTMQRSVANRCTFRWFYHMWSRYSSEMGKLSIIYQDLNNQSERILWQVAGGQGRGWKFGSVTFDITSFLYKIVIKAECGASFRSDIAVDDVSFAPECLQIQDFEPITITKNESCRSVKVTVNGTSASLYQFGSGREFCDVTIRTDPRLRISLYAEFFNTDSNKKVIIDAGRNGSVIYGGDFSGSLLPFSLISSTNVMNIRVPPFEGTGNHAFTFNITSTDHPGHSPRHFAPSGSFRLDVTRNCTNKLTRFTFNSSGTIRPRTSRYGYYKSNERCIFKFFAWNGYRIKFTFEMFETESDFDYIQILNNGIIGQARFSGSQYPFQFISKRSHLEMLFRTDKLIQLRGFWLSVVPTMEKALGYSRVPLAFLNPSLHSTNPWLVWYPGLALNETTSCRRQQRSTWYGKGGRSFGGVSFYGTRHDTHRWLSGNCSWIGCASVSSSYLLEFRQIDTGSVNNILRVRYIAGKQKEFRGYVNVKFLDLLEATNHFNITVNFNSDKPLKMRMVYSKSPGCYKDALKSNYIYKNKAYSGCSCVGYKYQFTDSNGNCYCNNHPPAYYGFFLQHPNFCSKCRLCLYGKLTVRTEKAAIGPGRSSATLLTVTITLAFLLCAICFGAWIFFHRRFQTPTHASEALASTIDEAGNQGTVLPYAYYVNAPLGEELLPSYEDAEKERLFFHGPQNAHPSIGEAPPSFEDAMQSRAYVENPQHSEIPDTSNHPRLELSEAISRETMQEPQLMDAHDDPAASDPLISAPSNGIA